MSDEAQDQSTQPNATTPEQGSAPAAGGALTLALVLVLLLFVGTLVYMSQMYFQLETRLAQTLEELEAAEYEVEQWIAKVAHMEALDVHAAATSNDEKPERQRPEAIDFAEFLASYEQVEQVGMPAHHFLLNLRDDVVWPLYGQLRAREGDRKADGADLSPEQRMWLGLIAARLGLIEQAQQSLELVYGDEHAADAWIEAAELFATWDDDEAVHEALETAETRATQQQHERIAEARERLLPD